MLGGSTEDRWGAGRYLRINDTQVSRGNNTASLQALGHVRLDAVMTDKVYNVISTGWRKLD
jgi:hypothetical protein